MPAIGSRSSIMSDRASLNSRPFASPEHRPRSHERDEKLGPGGMPRRPSRPIPPVVVLESTVIAQGLPWPENLETALEMEAAIRHAGAIPATIAILDGVPRIGLSPAEIERIARSAAPSSHGTGTGRTPRHTEAGPAMCQGKPA